MRKWMRRKQASKERKQNRQTREIETIVAGAFTVLSCITIIFVTGMLFYLFSSQSITSKTESAEKFLNQTKRSVEDYLRNNRQISDALYYSCIKNTDIAEDTLDEEFNLMYEANKDTLVNIALYRENGELVSSVPVADKRSPEEITSMDWFIKASNEVENLHFSMPYVKQWSNEPEEKYQWVISLSRQVELNHNGRPEQGVLLVNTKYSDISQMLEKTNSDNASDYIYLCDESGNIIYHPKQEMMSAGLYDEFLPQLESNGDGTYLQSDQKDAYYIIIKTVSYTGWKLVSVISKTGYNLGLRRLQFLVVLFVSITILGILLIIHQVSRSITSPLVQLDLSIRDLEEGNLHPEIYVGGPSEVEHLGKTLQTSLQRIRQLMDEVVEEQELKRISELDALQSQINPHFLYNTLDSVMWMIEDEQNDNAVYMVKELAKLLRISISKGKTIIPIRDEIMHARSYMNIQKNRYKCSCLFEIEEDILDCATIKLIIQPLLENAIYHGVKGMDEDGEILVRGHKEGHLIYLDVVDNGYGMSEDQIASLLSGENPNEEKKSVSTKGNGVGVQNVNNRIKLRFGPEYGLQIESEPDEGTMMRICIPYIPYSPDMEQNYNYRNFTSQVVAGEGHEKKIIK